MGESSKDKLCILYLLLPVLSFPIFNAMISGVAARTTSSSSGFFGTGPLGDNPRGVAGWDPKNSTHHFRWIRYHEFRTVDYVYVNMINSTTADGHVTSNLTDPVAAYNVVTKRNHGNFFSFKLRIYPLQGGYFDIWIDGGTKKVWCGLKQSYTSSDGVHMEIDPRGGLPDRWNIWKTKSGATPKYNITKDYTFFRKRHSLSGDIKNGTGFPVAHFHEKALSHSNKRFQHTISSNGELSDDVLVGLYWTVIVRLEICTI